MRERSAALLGAVGVLVLAATPAGAAPVSVTGDNGATLTVSATSDLDPAGTQVQVQGAGFDESVGIYVTFCVVPEPGQQPTPCLGGVDLEGESGASAWIASDPPEYGDGLATPYGEGGTFDVALTVAEADAFTDCADPAVAPDGCAIVARADHTRTADRNHDVLVPVTFASETGTTGTPVLLAGGGAAAIAVTALAVVAIRRRGRHAAPTGADVAADTVQP